MPSAAWTLTQRVEPCIPHGSAVDMFSRSPGLLGTDPGWTSVHRLPSLLNAAYIYTANTRLHTTNSTAILRLKKRCVQGHQL